MNSISRRRLFQTALALGLTGTSVAAQGLNKRPPAKPIPDSADTIAGAGFPGQVRFALFDPETGRMIEQQDATTPVAPASTLKNITALYALDRLGATHRFRTRVLRSGNTLILAGGGDPVLSSDDLATIADQVVQAGIKPPERFAVWGGALPRIEEIAPPQEDHLAYNPSVSGIILNFNRVYLGWRQANGDYQMALEARAAKNSPRAYTITAHSSTQSKRFDYRFDGKQEVWSIAGSAMGRAGSLWLPVRRPELYAGDVFQTLCRARGLVLPSAEVIDALPAGDEIASHESATLSDIIKDLLYYSTNVTAEVIGLHASGAADLASSATRMQQWAESKGELGEMNLADHSGLSADSRVSAVDMARLLAGQGVEAGLQALLKLDPLAGSVKPEVPPQAIVAAKTGTLNFVSNLAGYVSAPSGKRLVFSILCMDPARHAATNGQDLPAGVISWTRKAKRVQFDLLENWVQRFG